MTTRYWVIGGAAAMFTINGTCRCSATCAIASVAPDSKAPMSTFAPSLIAFSAWVRAVSALDSMSIWTTSTL